MEINIPEAAKLNVRRPVVKVEGVEIFDKDGAELAVVKEVDRSVVEVDLDGAGTEADEPEEDGDPPGESRTIAPLIIEPWLILLGEFLRQHGRRHGGPGFLRGNELRCGAIRSTIGTIEWLYWR